MFSLAAKEAEECSMLDRPNGPLKQGLRNICLKSKKQRKLIRFFINISGVLVIHDHLVKFWFNLLKKIIHKSNSTERFKNILRHELELKWIKRLQTPFPLGFNDNIYHEGNISKMPDFDAFSILDIKKRNKRSHGKRKNGNFKRKHKTVLSLFDLNILLNSGRHQMLINQMLIKQELASLSVSSLRKLDDEANKFYDRKHDLYEAALLTRCYTQHALRPYIDSEINHIRHFIKIPFINKGIEFIDLPSIFRDNNVISAIPSYSNNLDLLPPKPKLSFRYLKQGIQEFHRKYVLAPADKAANNVVVV